MKSVFESASIGPVKMKNRILRSATHEGLGMANGSPMVDELTAMYEKLAKGEAGAIITGFASVSPGGRALPTMRMFDDDRYIDDYKKLNAHMRALGTPLVLQLVHAGGQAMPGLISGKPGAPSRMRYALTGATARALPENEIRAIAGDFAHAIARAKKAGFAAVQLHAAHGYLISEFLSPHANRRKDAWGGSAENRFRFMREIMDLARGEAGDFPVWAKLSAYDFDRKGMRLDDSVKVAEMMQAAGVAAIEVSCGGTGDGFNTARVPRVPVEAMLAYMLNFREARGVKRALMKKLIPLIAKKHEPLRNFNVDAAAQIRKHVDVPVIVVGGIRGIADIREIIGSGKADFVSMSRPFIREPDIVKKLRTGAREESSCIDCLHCLMVSISNSVRCLNGKVPG